jgi:tetratricopeptide (TPR) repeat protein
MNSSETEWRRFYTETAKLRVEYYLLFAQQHASDFEGLKVELDDIYAVMEICLQQENFSLLAEFAKALNNFWINHGGDQWDNFVRYNHILLETDALPEGSERALILSQLAVIEEDRGNYTEARRLYEGQLQSHLKDSTVNPAHLILVLKPLARLATRQGDVEAARGFLEHWLSLTQNVKERVDVLLELAALYEQQPDLDRAEELCEQGLTNAQHIGYRVGILHASKQRASIHQAQKRYREARTFYRTALDIASAIGDQHETDVIREQLTILETAMGRNIFISYNHLDRNFAERLAQDLKAAGLSVWWDEWEIKVGDSIVQKVSDGIEQSAYLAVILSPHSAQAPWVKKELNSALMGQLSAERKIIILPLKIAECEIPILLSEIYWADFTQDYHAGIRKLLGAILEQGT